MAANQMSYRNVMQDFGRLVKFVAMPEFSRHFLPLWSYQ